MPKLFCPTKAMILNATNPSTNPLINNIRKLNHSRELWKKFTIHSSPAMQKLTEMMNTDMAYVII